MLLAPIATFAASFAVMALEVATARVLAPTIGVSLYTWTSLIGTVLAGLAVGSWVGGWLADRWSARAVMGGALALAALAALALLPLSIWRPLPPWQASGDVLGRLAWLTALLVLVPSTSLGAVVPAAARMRVRDVATAGRALGTLYALGALGSIAGTFATGLVLIDAVGSRGTIALSAGALAILAIAALAAGFRPGSARASWLSAAAAIGLGAPFALAFLFRGALAGPCTWESAYFCISIETRAGTDGPLRSLVLDKLIHSYSSLNDPTHLEYGYTRVFADVTEAYLGDRQRFRSLSIGGGGYTLPRYLEARYPEATIDVIEIDPRVTQAAFAFLGLDRRTRIRTFNEDARQLFIAQRPSAVYDVVYGDAFNDISIPYHLTTREFAMLIRQSLVPGGLYLANVIDMYPAGDFLRSYLATLRSVFPNLLILMEPKESAASPFQVGPLARDRERATFVIVASDAPIDAARLVPPTTSPDLALDPEAFEYLFGSGDAVLLTDDYAPVDRLTAPLFLSRYP